MAQNKAKTQSKNEATIKGKLVEMIVAAMHNAPDVKIQRNIKLPAIRNPKRKREIDVLISGSLAGYPVQIAVECKNYKSQIDAPKIDAYIGKLQDVGIPPQLGIYVSARGYTGGALERAKEVGMIPLLLTGLTPDRLSIEISKAIQSVIHLLLEVTTLEFHSPIDQVDSLSNLLFLYNQQGELKGAIPDLIWKKWIEGQPPSKLNEYNLEIEIPSGWGNYINGEYYPLNSAKAKVRITGFLVEFEGQASQHILINPIDGKVDRFQANAKFQILPGTYPVSVFSDEEGLQRHLLNIPSRTKLITRFRLPRIRFNYLYWPLSSRAATEFMALMKQCLVENRHATDEELKLIEGSDLKVVWEPMWEDNPFLKESTVDWVR